MGSRQGSEEASQTDEKGSKRRRLDSEDGPGGDQLAGDNAESKKRRNRFKSSCHSCQKSKAKCIKQEDWEKCSRCHKRNEECTFDPIILAGKTDSQVLRKIEAFEKRLEKAEALEKRLEALESRLARDAGPKTAGSSTAASLPADQLAHGELARTHEEGAFSASINALKLQANARTLKQPSTRNGPSWHSKHLPPYDEIDGALQTPGTRTPQNENDTESAAQALEDIALGGRRQYAAFGLNSETPLGQSSGLPSSSNAVLPPGSFTTIFSTSEHAKFDASLLQDVPPRYVADALVKLFFDDISFVYRIIHTPTFMAEYEQLYAHILLYGNDSIDPAWLSSFYMILATAAANAPQSHASLQYFGLDASRVANTWCDAAHRALEASGWASKPQARAIQAILLKMAYMRPGAPDAGTTFFVWTSVALRLCQLMNLHNLGDDENVMPPEDPAWPSQACSLRRELAKRIFWWSVAQDWMFSTNMQMQYLELGSFTTSLPADVDESDLGLNIKLPNHPATYLSDYSYTRVHFVVAHYQIVAAKLNAGHEGRASYDTVLKLDSGLQTEIARIEVTDQCSSNPNLRPYHKALLLTVLHNRILRLHRPFYMSAMSAKSRTNHPDRYQRSVEASIQSAKQVCRGLKEIGAAGHTAILWYVPAYGISAVLVIYVALLGKKDRMEDARSEEEHILMARSFYEAGRGVQTTANSSAPGNPSERACAIIDHLLNAAREHSSVYTSAKAQGVDRKGKQRGQTDAIRMAAGLFRQVSDVMAGTSPASSDKPFSTSGPSAASFLNGLATAEQTPIDDPVPVPSSAINGQSQPTMLATNGELVGTYSAEAQRQGQAGLLDSLSSSFPTLNLFKQNGMADMYNNPATAVTSFDSQASRYALDSLSSLGVPQDNTGSIFGISDHDWSAFLNLQGSPFDQQDVSY